MSDKSDRAGAAPLWNRCQANIIEEPIVRVQPMTAQTPRTILIPEKIMVALQSLPLERRQQVFDFVEFLALKANYLYPSRGSNRGQLKIRDACNWE